MINSAIGFTFRNHVLIINSPMPQDDTLRSAVAAYRGKSWKKIGIISLAVLLKVITD